MPTSKLKPLAWIGGSKRDIRRLPRSVRKLFGFALRLAQQGLRHPDAKSLKGFGSGALIEVVEDFDRNTYRAVYTVEFEGVVYVLHVFQKKSKEGSKTPRADIELIRKRLKDARADYRNRERGKDAEEGQSD
jgi:phage-related protein